MSQPTVSNYLIDKLLGVVYKNTSFTPPASTYLALFTTEPLPAASGTEVSGGSYARQPIAWGAITGHALTNSTQLAYTSSAPWGTVAWLAVFDAVSAGNMLTYTPIPSPIVVGSGTTVQVAIGTLSASWF